MANLPEVINFDAGVYQIETTDPVLGGPSGITNTPLKNLTNRTAYLKQHVDALEAGTLVPPGIATENYVQAELEKLDHKQSVRVATTANITLSGTQTIDGVAVIVGDRVLVKNQSTASQNGIYVVSASAWSRAADANLTGEVTSGMVTAVEEGTLQANSRWQLTTDGGIVIGTTALVFADVTSGYAPLASPTFTGNPAAPTAAQFDNDTSVATTEFVQRALGNFQSMVILSGNTTLTAADAGKSYCMGVAASITITLPLASGVSQGAVLHFKNNTSFDQTIVRQGSDVIAWGTASLAASFVVPAGTSATLIRNSAGGWLVSDGTADLDSTSLFARNLDIPGWQRLPGGMIMQWTLLSAWSSGTSRAFTWPIQFPSAFYMAIGGDIGTLQSAISVDATATGGTAYCTTAPGSAFVFGIGK